MTNSGKAVFLSYAREDADAARKIADSLRAAGTEVWFDETELGGGDAVIGGQVGFGDHTRVMSGAVIGSKAGILPGKIVRPGVWWGIPIQPLDEYKRLNAHLSRVPEMREEIKELKRQLEELKRQ